MTLIQETASPCVLAAHRLADEMLRPAAERVDLDGVPRSHLDALAQAGLLGVTAPAEWGGGGEPVSVGREVAELLAGACGATWFVWTQHALPLATLLRSTNESLRDQLLRPMVAGSALSGVAVAHLRRSGPPAVRATRTGGGWLIDGHAGWMTSWGLCDVLLLGAATSDGRIMLAFLDARDQPGLTASPPMALAAMQATSTVALDLRSLFVPDSAVAELADATEWLAADRLKTANPSPHTFGLQREIVHRLRDTAQRREDATVARLADALGREGDRWRDEAYRLIDDVPADEQVEARLRVRAASIELVVRSATALVAATGGSAMGRLAAPQRLAREALFHLVQAQTDAVREATLHLLLERSGPPAD